MRRSYFRSRTLLFASLPCNESRIGGYAKTDASGILDRWLHTGDIGQWNADGTLSIIDRKKNIFKLAQGEYIAVEPVENVVSKSKFVLQAWVYGNSFENSLVPAPSRT